MGAEFLISEFKVLDDLPELLSAQIVLDKLLRRLNVLDDVLGIL